MEATSKALCPKDRSALIRCQDLMVQRITCSNIIHSVRPFLAEDDYQKLRLEGKTEGERVCTLIECLVRGSQNQFDSFLVVLAEKGYGDIVATLRQPDSAVHKNDITELLVRGGVRFNENMTPRNEKVRLIRDALVALSQHSSYHTQVLVLHGMGGSGKTVLAAQAVQDAHLVNEYFQHGVVWQSVGHMRLLSMSQREDEILHLLANLLQHPLVSGEQHKKAHETLGSKRKESLQTELRNLLCVRRVLLVLDDAWHADVIEVFDGMPVLLLVTSRYRSVADRMSSNREYIEAMQCSEQEARNIVNKHMHCVDEQVMSLVLKRCKGLPLALSVMATTLAGKTTVRQQCLLETKSLWLLRPLPQLHAEYESLAEALEASILDLEQMLPARAVLGHRKPSGKDLLDIYMDLAVLDDDEEIFAEKASLVWRCSEDEAEELLQQLSSRALITKMGRKHDSSEQEVFTVHDVQLDFLRELVKSRPQDSMDRRHSRWVQGFRARSAHIDDNDEGEQLSVLPHASQLSRMVRVVQFGGEWWQCSEALVEVLEQWDGLTIWERETVTLLVVATKGKSMWSALHESCRQGVSITAMRTLVGLDPAAVKYGLSGIGPLGPHRSSVSFYAGTNAIHVACASGHLHLAKYLLEEKDGQVNITDENGKTALHYASEGGHLQVVKYLIEEKDAQVNIPDTHWGQTALHYAAYINYFASEGDGLQLVKYLVEEKGAQVNTPDILEGKTALHYASERGLFQIVKYLVEKDAQVNTLDLGENTALDCALSNTRRATCSACGMTLTMRMRADYQDVIDYLLQKGATATHFISSLVWCDRPRAFVLE